MMGSTRRIFATVAATVALSVGAVFGGAVTPAHAQGTQNGLVNVNVGDVSVLNNARIGVAAQVAATICGVNVGPVAVLAANVDATGVQRTVCTTDTGPVTISNL
jgi:uncharacterized protein (DUF697 family)